MKNFGFHVIAIALLIILVLTTGDAVTDLFEAKGKITTLSVLSAIVAISAAHYGLGSVLAELHKRFKSGTIHDFLYVLLRYYFPLHKPIKVITPSDLDRFYDTIFKHAIRNYCNKRLMGRDVYIKEITDLPFVPYIYYGDGDDEDKNERKLKPSENLIQNVCDFHFPSDDRNTFNTSFIIGNAGAGKSFAVKRIALSLLEKVKSKKDKILVPLPIPVSNWQQGSSLEGWVLNTVNTLFFSNDHREHIDEFLKHTPDKYEIVYLFDGLDEIKNEYIETFFTQVTKILGVKSIIFSTRKEIFNQFKNREAFKHLTFQYCELEELKQEKIESVLEENLKIEYLESVIKIQDVYKKFQTPLLLGVLTTVINSDKIPFDPKEFKANPLAYVWRNFTKIVHDKKSADLNDRFKFPLDKLLRYAHFLAKRENDGFSLDELQPKVLEGDTPSKLFYAIFTRLLIGLIISMGIGFTMSGPFDFIPAGLLGGLLSTLAFWVPVEKWIFRGTKNKRISFSVGIKIMLSSLVYLFVSLVVFGIFFSVTGQRRDMIELIAPADWIIGILFAVMFTILAGLHDLQYSFEDDIQLIQKRSIFHIKALDFPKALGFTLAFGFIVAIVCSSLAALYSRYFPTNIFTGWMQETSHDWGMTIFIMVFCIVLPIASSIGFLIGLNNPDNYKVDPKQLENLLPYFSITNTIYNSIILSFIVMLVFAGAWSLFNMLFFKTGWEGGNKGMESGFAAAIFIGIWWGWKDIIKTWVLRLILSLKGEASLSFPKMIKDLERVSILIRVGARYDFFDSSLDKYLEGLNEYTSYKRVNWVLPSLIIVIFLTILLRITWKEKFYWNESTSGLQISNYTKSVKKLSANRLKVLKSGKLIVQSRGLVRAGRILGHVTPLGTSTGFFGMPLKTSFNILPEGKHGTLMYRLGTHRPWKTVYNNSKVEFMDTYRFLKTYQSVLTVKQNDTLEFAVNDTEWQNNFKEFRIRIYSTGKKKKTKK